jgi:L-type amino acid transporter 9
MSQFIEAFHRLNLSGPHNGKNALASPFTHNRSGNDVKGASEEDGSPPRNTIRDGPAADALLNPGELSFEEDTAGGMGRHLGITSTTLLIVGRIIGTGIFSTPSSITESVGSVGAALMLWVLGLALSFAGLFVWLEFGCMFPRSGGEKVSI